MHMFRKKYFKSTGLIMLAAIIILILVGGFYLVKNKPSADAIDPNSTFLGNSQTDIITVQGGHAYLNKNNRLSGLLPNSYTVIDSEDLAKYRPTPYLFVEKDDKVYSYNKPTNSIRLLDIKINSQRNNTAYNQGYHDTVYVESISNDFKKALLTVKTTDSSSGTAKEIKTENYLFDYNTKNIAKTDLIQQINHRIQVIHHINPESTQIINWDSMGQNDAYYVEIKYDGKTAYYQVKITPKRNWAQEIYTADLFTIDQRSGWIAMIDQGPSPLSLDLYSTNGKSKRGSSKIKTLAQDGDVKSIDFLADGKTVIVRFDNVFWAVNTETGTSKRFLTDLDGDNIGLSANMENNLIQPLTYQNEFAYRIYQKTADNKYECKLAKLNVETGQRTMLTNNFSNEACGQFRLIITSLSSPAESKTNDIVVKPGNQDNNQTQDKTEATDQGQANKENDSASPSGQVYKNSALGFSVSIPDGYTIQISRPHVGNLSAETIRFAKKNTDLASEYNDIELNVSKDSKASLANLDQAYLSANSSEISSSGNTAIKDIPGKIYSLKGIAAGKHIIGVNNGLVLTVDNHFSSSETDAFVDNILKTFNWQS